MSKHSVRGVGSQHVFNCVTLISGVLILITDQNQAQQHSLLTSPPADTRSLPAGMSESHRSSSTPSLSQFCIMGRVWFISTNVTTDNYSTLHRNSHLVQSNKLGEELLLNLCCITTDHPVVSLLSAMESSFNHRILKSFMHISHYKADTLTQQSWELLRVHSAAHD